MKKYRSTGLVSEKNGVFVCRVKERAQPPIVILQQANFLNIVHELVHEFSFAKIFNDINHGYRAALLKKNSLRLLPFYCYYEKVRRMMCTAIVSYLLQDLLSHLLTPF